MSKFKTAQDKNFQSICNNFRIYYLSQSTAFITPILYLFVQNKLALSLAEILQISAVYGLLLIFFQLPCGIAADRWGTKGNLYVCLVLQIFSCCALIFLQGSLAFHAYLICIYLAQVLYAGSSTALIKKQFLEENGQNFKNHLLKLQNSFYKFTSLILIFSAFLYTLDERIPFYLQIANFIISFYFLKKIPEQYISAEKSKKNIFYCSAKDIKKSICFIFSERKYLYLIICATLFNLGISINQKSIQSQLFSEFKAHQAILIGCVYAVGNLFSSFGAKLFYKFLSKRFSTSLELTILSGLLIVSYLLMGFNGVATVVLGFMIINVFKGCYRPIISAELVNEYPFKNSLNTNLSIVYLLSVFLSSIIQYIVSFNYINIENGNLLYAFLSIVILAIGYLFSKFQSDWKIIDKNDSITQKKSFIKRKDNSIFYIQEYPSHVPIEHLQHIQQVTELSKYPTKPHYIFHVGAKKGIETQFLGDTLLCDILDTERQYKICEQIFCHTASSHTNFPKAKILQEGYIFRPQILNLLKQEPLLCTMSIIHGDLHPENILVFENNPYIIDWDLSGSGPFWYDLLSLLTHPYLYFDKSSRIEFFLSFCKSLNINDIELIFYSFSQFKINQLNSFSDFPDKWKNLAQKYKELSTEYMGTFQVPS